MPVFDIIQNDEIIVLFRTFSTIGAIVATVTSLVDDLDGTRADETLIYSVEGQYYKIDLSTSNAEQFRDTLRPYMAVSTQIEAKAAKRPVVVAGELDYTVIRAWAKEQGHKVSDRGRISDDIVQAWQASQK